MKIKTIAKGILIGSAIGTVCYVASGTTPRQRKHMKKLSAEVLEILELYAMIFLI